MALRAASTVSASPGIVASGASAQSVSSANRSAASGLASAWTSRRSAISRACPGDVSSVGTTTKVRLSAGMPWLASSRGSVCGGRNRITFQLTNVTAKSSTGRKAAATVSASRPALAPPASATRTDTARPSAVTRAMLPR